LRPLPMERGFASPAGSRGGDALPPEATEGAMPYHPQVTEEGAPPPSRLTSLLAAG
jgi:hypothetical protein